MLAILHFFWMRSGKQLYGEVADYAAIMAVLLGWLILRESITARTIGAMVLILGAVLMIQLAAGAQKKRGTAPERQSVWRKLRRAGV